MITKTLTIQNKLGLHARASMVLMDTATRFQSRISIKLDNRAVDAKSIMQVMALAAKQGTPIELIVDGSDEVEAMAAMEQIIGDGFGEL